MEKQSNGVSRRDFMKQAAIGAAGAASMEFLSPVSSTAAEAGMPFRILGKTGMKVSLLTFGGGSQFLENKDGVWEPMLEKAVAEGVNLFDTAPSYHWNYPQASEDRFGAILAPYRNRIYLSTKMDSRDVTTALSEFERSLQRLKTDYVDLLLIHDVNNNDSFSAVERGVYKEAVRLKEEGAARFIGFSSMSSAIRSKEFIEAMDFDVVILALTPTLYGDYAATPLPAARERNIGVLGMKVMRNVVGANAAPKELLEYVWNLSGVATTLVGHIGMATFEENLQIAKTYGASKIKDSYRYSMQKEELEKRLAHLATPDALCWANSDYRDRKWC
ncbi:MAG: aldo/keto reductase [Candidatus Omnitrophota bacterium]